MDRSVLTGTETAVRRILPSLNVLQIGGLSIMDRGQSAVMPLLITCNAQLMAEKAVMASTSCAVCDRPVCAGIHATASPQKTAIPSRIQWPPGIFARSAVMGGVFDSVDLMAVTVGR